VEGDLAESWTQPSDTTYVFKLRRGVRWHGKPPVNGPVLEQLEKIEALDRAILYDIQRYLAEQAYYLYGPSGKVISAGSHTSRPSCRISATTMAAG